MLDRRRFLASVGAAASAESIRAGSPNPTVVKTDYEGLRGFNYQPSFGSSGFEIWQNFNASTVEKELSLGKKYFPKIEAIRLWLSWDSFNRNPGEYGRRFTTALEIASSHSLLVMPVLFNRWHDATLDYGGIYLDHILPRASWVQKKDTFGPFLEAIVGRHADDRRIFAWDLCNEPFAYSRPPGEIPEVVKAEYAWLKETYHACKRLGARGPFTVGIHPGHKLDGISQIEPLSDVLSIHPYWTGGSKAEYETLLDGYVAFANRVGKPLLASETCWGSLDDEKRVATIRYTLGELKKRKIGWLAYLLHHSLIADAHRPEFGPVSDPGNLSFIEADGRLRQGHGVFNDY